MREGADEPVAQAVQDDRSAGGAALREREWSYAVAASSTGDGKDSGIPGLPIRGPGRPGYAHLDEGSASVFFLQNRATRFEELGELAAGMDGAVEDGCIVSCVDWYGNAWPLFLRGRIFALLGYEIVEGRVVNGRIRETRRISYAPRPIAEGD